MCGHFLGGKRLHRPIGRRRAHDAMIAIAERRMNKTGLADVLRRQFPRA
jgi:hypothetical protein